MIKQTLNIMKNICNPVKQDDAPIISCISVEHSKKMRKASRKGKKPIHIITRNKNLRKLIGQVIINL